MRKIIRSYEASSSEYISRGSSSQFIAGILEKVVSLKRTGRVLDIGCGPGRDVRLFSEKGFDTVGIEGTPSFIQNARLIAPKAQIIEGDFSKKLPFAQKSFDVIWACNSLHHLPRRKFEKKIEEISKLIKL